MLEDDDDDEALARTRLQGSDGAYLWERNAVGAGAWDAEHAAGSGGGGAGAAGRQTLPGSAPAGACRRGLARHMVLVLDCSASMEQSDPPPSRLLFVVKELRAFLAALFLACPLSSVSLLASSNGTCARLCSLSSSLTALNAALDAVPDPAGLPSVQHALDMATAELRYSPAHCTREVLFVLSSLSTADPGSIHESIAAAVEQRLVLNTLHLAAEVHVFKQMTVKSGGTHSTSLDPPHFHALLHAHVEPPALTSTAQTITTLVLMGFPDSKLCPRCGASSAHTVPGQCSVCTLPLIRASHLARSYHHLLPVPAFASVDSVPADSRCGGCGNAVAGAAAQCPRCTGHFCFACDSYIHTQLHVCPTCQ